ncbi:hypothetical protein ACWFRJ_03605 [Streptomyces sp. NPDC055239]
MDSQAEQAEQAVLGSMTLVRNEGVHAGISHGQQQNQCRGAITSLSAG